MRYGLLDGQVVFLKGLFSETLPRLDAFPLALLRVDGDWYSSTTDVLEEMYPNLSVGGFVILDDYGPVVDSRRAVLDFRARHGIAAPMFAIDGDGVFLEKGTLEATSGASKARAESSTTSKGGADAAATKEDQRVSLAPREILNSQILGLTIDTATAVSALGRFRAASPTVDQPISLRTQLHAFVPRFLPERPELARRERLLNNFFSVVPPDAASPDIDLVGLDDRDQLFARAIIQLKARTTSRNSAPTRNSIMRSDQTHDCLADTQMNGRYFGCSIWPFSQVCPAIGRPRS